MAFESQARSYIIKLCNCLNKDITLAPYLYCNILVRIINNYCVECLYFRDCIFKFVSFSFITLNKNFRFLVRLWANNNNKLAIQTGNTILKCEQCDVCTLCLCYDSGNARNRFQRSECTSMLLSAQCLLFPSATILFSRCMSAIADVYCIE
jgi:hypothetical protein